MKRLLWALLISLNINAATYVSLKSSEVNLRVGPGKEYPVSWVLLRSGLPVMLVTEFDQWRKIQLLDGTEGWVHKSMLSAKNNAIVSSEYAILYKSASSAHPVAKLENGVIVRCLKIDGDWVKVEVNKIRGWLRCRNLWGVNESH